MKIFKKLDLNYDFTKINRFQYYHFVQKGVQKSTNCTLYLRWRENPQTWKSCTRLLRTLTTTLPPCNLYFGKQNLSFPVKEPCPCNVGLKNACCLIFTLKDVFIIFFGFLFLILSYLNNSQ